MLVSGFTIVRNAIKFNYPVVESIKSILPICDEFIVNVGDCEDNTLELIQSIKDPKLKIIRNNWDFSKGELVLSQQSNIALSQCKGDWAIYLQSDEVIHEKDLPRLKKIMQKFLSEANIDALRFKWLHFYGSFYRYRIDSGWFQKEDRIIRNNGQIHLYSGAFGFERKDKKPLRRIKTGCFIYHYGWVQPPDTMTKRRINAESIGFTQLFKEERVQNYDYGNLERFPIYFGTHPNVMNERILSHQLSREDCAKISRKYWWSPFRIFRVRYKTFKRVDIRICR
ncbi:MAG: glycosyltransferase [Candidatus Omnitrophota bacterium]|nr:glycosyltransferase [Candidatus Omnitrophota bacterium]